MIYLLNESARRIRIDEGYVRVMLGQKDKS